MDPLYRIRQWVRAANALPLTPEECQRVRGSLNDAAFALYQTMPPGDQRHSLKIHDTLVRQGFRARPLLEAALLHDVAKRDVSLRYRTCAVLLNKLSPHAVELVASASPRSWRYPFYVALHHPEIGAGLAAQAGCQELTPALIRAHQTDAPQFDCAQAQSLRAWHRALKSLDDIN